MTNLITFTESGAGRPVLILHGGGGPATVASIAAHVARTARAIVPTLPGWNGVPRADSLATPADFAAGFVAFLENEDLRDVLVIGSSLGGWIAAEIALQDAAQRVNGLVIIDGAGIDIAGEPMRNFFALTPREVAEYSFHDGAKFYIDPETVPAEQLAARRANMQTMAAIAGDPYMHDPTLLERLGRIAVPTLVIWGESDRIFTPGYGRAYATAIFGARFELVDGAGHLPHLEQPESTFALIDTALLQPGN